MTNYNQFISFGLFNAFPSVMNLLIDVFHELLIQSISSKFSLTSLNDELFNIKTAN